MVREKKKNTMMILPTRWMLTAARFKAAGPCHVLSRFKLPFSPQQARGPVARWREGGLRGCRECGAEGEGRAGSRRPLAVLAIGSENRRNVGQLCHPFEVGTACL